MKSEDKIWLASKAAEKGWDYETLKYSDDLYDEKDDVVDEVWTIVEEYRYKGSKQFREDYIELKLYP